MRSAPPIITAIVVGVLLLVGGIWLGGHPETLPGFARNALVGDDRALRAELINDIKDNYYKPVSDHQIEESSLKGIVEGLNDRFSNYLTPHESKQFEDSVQGRFDGVGMSVDQDKRGLRVLNVFEDSPAKNAGIKKGDFVIAVNGESLAGVSSAVATAKIKGPPGTTVRLRIADAQAKTSKSYTLKRSRISVPVASGRVVTSHGKRYGVVKLQSFSEGAHGLLRAQVDKVRRQGAKGIVLDLRGNGGGLLREGVLVSSIFIDKGLITYTQGRSSPRRDFDAQGGAIPAKVPVVVLVDGGTASASEIVTGALRDRHRATVVGTRTFGKGVFQQVLPLSNGGVLDITVGEYFLPSGKNINKVGIKPSVKAPDNPKTARDEALPKALDALSRG